MNSIDKPWGREEWLVLNEKYCLKRLYVNEGKKLSLQYHEVKKETMFLESGVCDLLLNGETILMILEVSTPEVEDVVRIEDDYGRPKYGRRKGDKKSQIKGENT